jgi:hypothetical protein
MPQYALWPSRYPVNNPATIKLTRRPIAGPERVAGASGIFRATARLASADSSRRSFWMDL